MLTEYLSAAMRLAHYEIVEDSGEFWGEIPGFQGVWACEPTLEASRTEFLSALEDWILFRVSQGLELPVVEGLRIHEVA